MVKKFGRTAVFAAVVVASGCALAKTCVWTGAGQVVDNMLKLFDADNWEGGVTPEDGDTLLITTKSTRYIDVNESGHTFANIIYTNTYSGATSSSAMQILHNDLTLTGTESKFTTIGKNIYFGTAITIAENAKVEFCQEAGSLFQFGAGSISGKGEVVISGSRASGKNVDEAVSLASNSNFSGMWNIYRPISVAYGVNDPFGGDDATVNIYGTRSGTNSLGVALYPNWAGRLTLYGGNTISGEINFFHKPRLGVSKDSAARDRIVTFNGNVTYTALEAANQMIEISEDCNGKEYTSGFVFKKNLICAEVESIAIKPYMNIYTYARGTYHFEVRGEFRPNRSSNWPPQITLTTSTGIPPEDQLAEVYFGGPVVGTYNWKIVYQAYHHFHAMKANILTGTHCLGYNSSRDWSMHGAYLDLHGYDQTISELYYRDPDKHPEVGANFVIQSTGRPATIKVGNSETQAHQVPKLEGNISFYGYALSKGNDAHVFTNTYETCGWIGTERNLLDLAETAKFPNLGGIECTGAGSVLVRSGAEFNSNMTLDVHDMTGDKIRIPTGMNIDVKHVFEENVDLPAGMYCRTGAGVEGATEVSWLNKVSTDTDDMKGTVTVAAHDPVWIWTGGGSSSSFTDAANWGANAAPDLSNSRLTINLKNAAGKADMVVPLDGTIAPAGAFNCGDFSKDNGAVTFGGSGTLVLGDEGASATNDLKMVFTESTSFTWNGSGTLYLTGVSTSTGTLTVNSGKVIMDYAAWAGKVVVAAGAELVVDTNCGNGVFAADAEVDLNGRLTIGDMTTAGDEMALAVYALRLDGRLAHHDKTYGSDVSAAKIKNAVHFSGPGTIVSSQKSGLTTIIR